MLKLQLSSLVGRCKLGCESVHSAIAKKETNINKAWICVEDEFCSSRWLRSCSNFATHAMPFARPSPRELYCK